MSAKQSKPSALPTPDAKPPRELSLVRHIAEQWAPAIIAEGLFTNDAEPLWQVLLCELVKQDPSLQILERELEAFFARPDADARLPHPLPVDDANESWASEMAASRAYEWGELGFLVGVGVDMTLGPHAFAPRSIVNTKGGAR